MGFQALGFWNNEVLINTAVVLEVTRQALSPTLSREQDLSTTHFPGAREGAERGR